MFRSTPHFPGKLRLSEFFNFALTNKLEDYQAVVTARLRDGSVLRLDLRSGTEWPAFWSGSYDRSWLDLLLPWLPRNAVVIDVGANIGFYAIPLGHRLKQLQGRLVAVEPVPSNFARLLENIAFNRLENVINPVRVALADREGTALLQRDAQHHASTGNAVVVGNGHRGQPNATAPLTTLDRLAEAVDLQKCHLIKADIEGGEYSLLLGGRELIQRCRPLVLCEINPFWMERFSWTFQQLQALARSLQYSLFERQGQHLVPACPRTSGISDILLVPNGLAVPGKFPIRF